MRSPGLVCGLLYVSLCIVLPAQHPTGIVQLLVKDPAGVAMQAGGRLRGLTSTLDRSFVTDSQGSAALKDLVFGRYRLDVSQSGFATQTLSIDVPSSGPVAVSVTLALAGTSSQTEVVGTTPLAGLDLAREEIAAPVQRAGRPQLAPNIHLWGQLVC